MVFLPAGKYLLYFSGLTNGFYHDEKWVQAEKATLYDNVYEAMTVKNRHGFKSSVKVVTSESFNVGLHRQLMTSSKNRIWEEQWS